MAERESSLFLARRTYRRRRVRDGSRLLPVFGTFLFLLPLLWETGAEATDLAHKTIYLFAVWFMLVAAAAGVARWYAPDEEQSAKSQREAARPTGRTG